jgi:uncharacterized protein (UPF0210 family)
MYLPPVRTVTLGVAEPHPLPADVVERAVVRARRAGDAFRAAGYEVQTLRLSTRPVFDDLVAWEPSAIVDYARGLQGMLNRLEFGFCSLGPARADVGEQTIADVLARNRALSATVELATVSSGIRTGTAWSAARVTRKLAEETEEGFGNFRFAVLACVPPGSPFFPAAYHNGPASLAVGLQGAGIVAEALRSVAQPLGLDKVTEQVRTALKTYAEPIVALAGKLAEELGCRFGGIDLSPAPAGTDSIAAAMELAGYGAFGSPGTLALAGALTAALKCTGLPACGYNGLMLPVLEDATLAQRWADGQVNVHQLLAYSAVCGTGLDTVPLPGDLGEDDIAALLLDVATLAVKLRKPLSARLFPVPGKRVGESTDFSSPLLVNTVVRW